eukprot:GHRR01002226.1.p1 GENE.GHRR01002226.1~~GHRR01002226.1.p1  ORF type:complete len:225 (+),score=52.89 GHRR01002226.1:244-918(+)
MQQVLHCNNALSCSRCQPYATHLSQHLAPRQHWSHRSSRLHVQAAAGGFGKSNKKKLTYEGSLVIPKEGKRVKGKDLLLDEAPARNKGDPDSPPGFPKDWIDLKLKAGDIPLGKATKPVELATGRVLMLYKFDNKVYISDANSTAYQYPMTDARVFKEGNSVVAEVPLDGTVYDLATGAVLKWCPKDNPMRTFLSTLKSAAEVTPLKVYPVHITQQGSIWTKLW